ncbi:hypothetical protein ACTU44_21915 (plasmid) [Thalassospira sp. SM2505]
MSTLTPTGLRDLLHTAIVHARDKVADDYELARRNEWNIYTDDDRDTMREQLAEYDEFLSDPDRWFLALVRHHSNNNKDKG